MDRIHKILNSITEAAQKTYKEQKSTLKSNTKSGYKEDGMPPFKKGDMVHNINKSCMHYGSQGIVEDVEPLNDDMGYVVKYKTVNCGLNWERGQMLKKTESQLEKIDVYSPDLTDIQEHNKELLGDDPKTLMPAVPAPEATPPQSNEMEDVEEVEEPSDLEEQEEEGTEELDEYKKDFYEMSLGSLRAIAQHSKNILDHLELPYVKENLTESWLQGKIAITEDYMRTIHDFIMYVAESADTVSAADKPGLWENIRKKKERMGKKYRPAKPGDKDRPDLESWKKAQ